MAQLGFTIAPEDAKEPSFEGVSTPVPAGWYDAVIKKADILETKAGGHRINVRYDITGPTHAGRVIFGSININHPSNPKVSEIGKEQLATIAAALKKRISDTDDLINGALRIKVKVSKSEQYGEQNDIAGWGISSSAIPASQSGLVGSTAPKSGTNPPWVK
jgi:hypothetical protein